MDPSKALSGPKEFFTLIMDGNHVLVTLPCLHIIIALTMIVYSQGGSERSMSSTGKLRHCVESVKFHFVQHIITV